MTLYRGIGGTGEARTDTDITEVRAIMLEAKGYRDEAQTAAEAAVVDSSAAEAAAAAAALSEEHAATSETNAASSETAAASSESAAATSETNAATSETNAAASEAAAATSEANAAMSETNAAASEAAAALSETNAATSETNAAASESAAALSESNAADSEASAAASAAAAAISEANAATSEANAEAAWDSFDDRYLGAKSSDPATDNDGNTLLTGALYWNTTTDEIKIWNGTGWAFFSGLPSQTGNSGKFLTTNGSVPAWAVIPDPQPATPTDDGLVFGFTDASDVVDSTIPYWYSYHDGVENVDFYQGLSINYSIDINNFISYTSSPGPVVGDHVYIDQVHPSTGVFVRTIDLGTITTLHYYYASQKYGFRTDNTINLAPYAIGGSYPTVKGRLYKKSESGSLGANVSLGKDSNDSGYANTTIGYGAGSTITTGSNLTVIGYDAEPSSAIATNEATLGNSSTTKTRLWGAIAVDDDTGTSGQVLTSNGTGSATWETPASAPVTSVNGYTGAVSLTASDVGAATSSDISTAIAALVDSAPTTLDTLNELAAALGDDANFASTVTTALAAKAPLSNPTFTGTVTADYLVGDGSGITGIDSLPSQAGNSGKYLTTDGTDASWAVLDTDANTTTKGLYEMANTISTNYSITSGNNAMSAGPISVSSGVVVTVPSGSVWTIV